MSFIESSVMADGSVVLTGVTDYWTDYGSNEVTLEWEATIKNNAIVTRDARVVNGWEPIPLTVVDYQIYKWMREQRAAKVDETAHYRAVL